MTTPAELREAEIERLKATLAASYAEPRRLLADIRAWKRQAMESRKRAEAAEALAREHEAALSLSRDQTTYATEALYAMQKSRDEHEAEAERLKWCGTCKHLVLSGYELETRSCADWEHVANVPAGGFVEFWDRCHFTPSRWTERGEA